MAKVLMFHRVLPEKQITQPNAYSTFGTLISQEYFEVVLSLLTDNDFQFVTISGITQHSDTDKLVALTFDDTVIPTTLNLRCHHCKSSKQQQHFFQL